MSFTDEDLQRLKDLENKASKRPWVFDDGNIEVGRTVAEVYGLSSYPTQYAAPGFNSDADTELIAYTRNALHSLLARLETAEDLILNHTITPICYDEKYKTWKKAAGKK